MRSNACQCGTWTHGTSRAGGKANALLEKLAMVETRAAEAAQPQTHPRGAVQPDGGPAAPADKDSGRRLARGGKRLQGLENAGGRVYTAVRCTVEHRQTEQPGKPSTKYHQEAKQRNANDTDPRVPG